MFLFYDTKNLSIQYKLYTWFNDHLYNSDRVKSLAALLAATKAPGNEVVTLRKDEQELECMRHNQKASRPILLKDFSGVVGQLLANNGKMAYEEYVRGFKYKK